MPKASEVAAELRKLADSLDQQPDVEITQPNMFFAHWDGKDLFKQIVKLLPHPLTKSVSDGSLPDLRVEYKSKGLFIRASIQQSKMCRIVEPAKAAVYDCDPILSPEEDAALLEAQP